MDGWVGLLVQADVERITRDSLAGPAVWRVGTHAEADLVGDRELGSDLPRPLSDDLILGRRDGGPGCPRPTVVADLDVIRSDLDIRRRDRIADFDSGMACLASGPERER